MDYSHNFVNNELRLKIRQNFLFKPDLVRFFQKYVYSSKKKETQCFMLQINPLKKWSCSWLKLIIIINWQTGWILRNDYIWNEANWRLKDNNEPRKYGFTGMPSNNRVKYFANVKSATKRVFRRTSFFLSVCIQHK